MELVSAGLTLLSVGLFLIDVLLLGRILIVGAGQSALELLGKVDQMIR